MAHQTKQRAAQPLQVQTSLPFFGSLPLLDSRSRYATGLAARSILKLRAYQVDADIGIKGISDGVEHGILLIAKETPEKFISTR